LSRTEPGASPESLCVLYSVNYAELSQMLTNDFKT